MQFPLHHGSVGGDLPVNIQHEMQAADGVLPVVVGERVLLVRPECLHEERADTRGFGGGSSWVSSSWPRGVSSAIRARTSSPEPHVGSGLSGVNRIVPFGMGTEPGRLRGRR